MPSVTSPGSASNGLAYERIHDHPVYKYRLTAPYTHPTGVIPPLPVITGFIELDGRGMLTTRIGYAWDGPSGPAPDTPSAMRASLVHDALYQLLRDRRLLQSARKAADQLYRDIYIEDGRQHPFPPLITAAAWVSYVALRLRGGPRAAPRPLLKDPPMWKKFGLWLLKLVGKAAAEELVKKTTQKDAR